MPMARTAGSFHYLGANLSGSVGGTHPTRLDVCLVKMPREAARDLHVPTRYATIEPCLQAV